MSNRTVLRLLALLIALFGVRELSLFASSASASVTGVERVISQTVEAIDPIYTVSYRLSLDGGHYAGSYQEKAFNRSRLPRAGQRIRVDYLPIAPSMNRKSGDGPWLGIACLALLPGWATRRREAAPHQAVQASDRATPGGGKNREN